VGAVHNIYERGIPRGIPTSPARIIAQLLVERHASLVAREEGVSFAKVWQLADRECIEPTAEQAKGYWALSRARGVAVIGVRHVGISRIRVVRWR
jgi:hypothetical protein